jgi:hypothetical protein
MGLFLLIGVLFLAVTLVASQFPHWLTALALVANIAAYVLIWGGIPERWNALGSQTFHISVLVGGQVAAILGLLAPAVWPGLGGSPRWLRALGAGVITLPAWLMVPVVFY